LLVDRSGLGNHGVLTNMDAGTDWVASGGKLALDLDGSNDYVLMPNDYGDMARWTVSLWGRWPVVAGGAYSGLWVGKFGSVSGNGIGFHSTAGHCFLLRGNAVPANRRISVVSGEWFHAVATYDGSVDALYVNGVAATAGAADSGFGITNTRIGWGYSSNYFAGQLDAINVYDRVLTYSEILTLGRSRGIEHDTVRMPIVRGAVAGGQTIALGVATETDAAIGLSISNPRSYALGVATETDAATALTIANPRSYAVGVATETDAANGLSIDNPRSYSLGLATETDTANGLTISQGSGQTIALGVATEADAAPGLTISNPRSYAVGVATEVNAALAVSILNPRSYSLGVATETDTARGLTISSSGTQSAGLLFPYYSTLRSV
jgi:hypothetical protein